MGVCERYFPRDGLEYVKRWQRHLVHGYPKFESKFRPGMAM